LGKDIYAMHVCIGIITISMTALDSLGNTLSTTERLL
jgi:hypothetical protein